MSRTWGKLWRSRRANSCRFFAEQPKRFKGAIFPRIKRPENHLAGQTHYAPNFQLDAKPSGCPPAFEWRNGRESDPDWRVGHEEAIQRGIDHWLPAEGGLGSFFAGPRRAGSALAKWRLPGQELPAGAVRRRPQVRSELSR